MAKNGINKLGVPCIYCGLEPSTRKGDHAVPQANFLSPLPEDMVTVPACIRCNQEKSQLDEYVRDALVLDIDASRNSVAQELVRGSVSRAVAKNRSQFFKTAVAGARRVPRFTPLGVYVEDVISVPVDDKMIRRQLKFMVKGLYFWVKRERIPSDYQYEITRIRRDAISNLWDFFATKSEGAGQIGEGVFACRYTFGLENAYVSSWLLIFYNSIAYMVTVVPRGGLEAYIRTRNISNNNNTNFE
jgi:hypothetical protein